ncbi:MAG: YbjN domain-containing protein [Muribaculaceae bacterium]|nr:YbjN domain-containing protein [Muribaculaceae bacterium]
MYGFEYLKKFLREEGYKIREEEDDHFTFKFQGTTYVAFKNESPYLQVIVICNTEQFPRQEILEVCNQINKDRYIVKCVAMDGSVWVSYEFLPNETTPGDFYEFVLSELDSDSDLLFKKLTKEE